MNINHQHPNIEAFIVVMATSIILLGRDNWLPNNYAINFIEKMGDWSYSVYLVHWPLFAFAYLGYAGDVPSFVMIAMIFISMI